MQDTLSIALRFVNHFLGKGDETVARELLAPEVKVITGLKPSGPIEGIDEYLVVFRGFASAFRFTEPLHVLDAFATPDRAVVRFHARATHVAPYFGVAASQRSILFDETHVMRLGDGRIVENIVSATNLEFEMLMAPVLAPMILGPNG